MLAAHFLEHQAICMYYQYSLEPYLLGCIHLQLHFLYHKGSTYHTVVMTGFRVVGLQKASDSKLQIFSLCLYDSANHYYTVVMGSCNTQTMPRNIIGLGSGGHKYKQKQSQLS